MYGAYDRKAAWRLHEVRRLQSSATTHDLKMQYLLNALRVAVETLFNYSATLQELDGIINIGGPVTTESRHISVRLRQPIEAMLVVSERINPITLELEWSVWQGSPEDAVSVQPPSSMCVQVRTTTESVRSEHRRGLEL